MLDLKSRIENLRSGIWDKIGTATRVKDSKKVSFYTEILKKVEHLTDEFKKIEGELRSLELKTDSDSGKGKKRRADNEDALKNSFAESIKREFHLEEDFRFIGRSQIVFSNSRKRFLFRYSSFQRKDSKWFWGVSKKYWIDWSQQDYLALVFENELGRYEYLLLNSQESKTLFENCSRSKGDIKINMRIYSDGVTRLQEYQNV